VRQHSKVFGTAQVCSDGIDGGRYELWQRVTAWDNEMVPRSSRLCGSQSSLSAKQIRGSKQLCQKVPEEGYFATVASLALDLVARL
jgi:hypothetical protein